MRERNGMHERMRETNGMNELRGEKAKHSLGGEEEDSRGSGGSNHQPHPKRQRSLYGTYHLPGAAVQPPKPLFPTFSDIESRQPPTDDVSSEEEEEDDDEGSESEDRNGDVSSEEEDEEDDDEGSESEDRNGDVEEEESSSSSGEEEEEEEDTDGDDGGDDDDDEEEEEEEEEMGQMSADVANNGPVSVTLTSPALLDCRICGKPLASSIFQCEQGHLACGSCCKDGADGWCCSISSWDKKLTRCLALERVLESLKIRCKNVRYGCKETISYNKRLEHDSSCLYAPSSCPHSTCNFVAAHEQLKKHLSRIHPNSVVRFNFGSSFSIWFDNKVLVLLEEKSGTLFTVNKSENALGNMYTVCCFGSTSSEDGYLYELSVKKDGSTLRFQSLTKNIRKIDPQPPSSGFLLVPKIYDRTCMCVCIFGTRPAIR
ncbi:hypothetical protein Tsubulata_032138 [Turnera subulata]|uniref:SIAH-type domain-containing protein n=1 Tax=Turnera subulata TaxID=218843 RepID=A0A9Q0F2A3_9ROSI|nr:hypothetical protein Tsubulata_032138 [Turnera subulata]